MKNLKLSVKLLLAFALMLIFTFQISLIAYQMMMRMAVSSAYIPYSLLPRLEAVRSCMMAIDQLALDGMDAGQRAVVLDKVRDSVGKVGEVAGHATNTARFVTAMTNLIHQQTLTTNASQAAMFKHGMQTLAQDYHTGLHSELEQAAMLNMESANQGSRMVTMASMVMIPLTLILALLVTRSIVKPLRDLYNELTAIEQRLRDDGAAVPRGKMADLFTHLACKLGAVVQGGDIQLFELPNRDSMRMLNAMTDKDE